MTFSHRTSSVHSVSLQERERFNLPSSLAKAALRDIAIEDFYYFRAVYTHLRSLLEKVS